MYHTVHETHRLKIMSFTFNVIQLINISSGLIFNSLSFEAIELVIPSF